MGATVVTLAVSVNAAGVGRFDTVLGMIGPEERLIGANPAAHSPDLLNRNFAANKRRAAC